MPKDVINMRIKTAPHRYDFNIHCDRFQNLYKNDVATNLPNSNEDAITMAAIDAPENNNPIPQIEKNAAHPAMNNAEKPSNRLKLNKFLFIVYKYQIK
jgi:hypothetical protein